MTNYLTAYKDEQKVTQVAQNDAWNSSLNDNASLFNDRSIPFILAGLKTSISDTGNVTITPGSLVGEPFTSTDEPDLPATDGLTAYSVVVGEQVVAVTSVSPEYGYIVVRQDLQPKMGPLSGGGSAVVGYTLVLSYHYRAGTAVAYPVRLSHDTLVVGVQTVVAGSEYVLDYSVRDEDNLTYGSKISSQSLVSDPEIATNSPFGEVFAIAIGEMANISTVWDAYVPSSSNSVVTVHCPILTDSQIDGFSTLDVHPTTESKIIVSGSNSNEINYVQRIDSIGRVSGKWITVSFVSRVEASVGVINVVASIQWRDGDTTDEILVSSSVIPLTLTDEYKLYQASIFVPAINHPQPHGADSLLNMVINVTSANNYTAFLTNIYFQLSRSYQTPIRPVADNSTAFNKILEHYSEEDGAFQIGSLDGDVQEDINDLKTRNGNMTRIAAGYFSGIELIWSFGVSSIVPDSTDSWNINLTTTQPHTNFYVNYLPMASPNHFSTNRNSFTTTTITASFNTDGNAKTRPGGMVFEVWRYDG